MPGRRGPDESRVAPPDFGLVPRATVGGMLRTASVRHMRVLSSAIFALPLFLPSPGRAAPPPPSALRGFLADVWQAEDGLPHNAVQAIVQTRDGYLWLGTPTGVARFDGVRFTPFRPPELTHHNIHALLEDRDGALWIGTYGGGLYRYDGLRVEAFGPAEGLGSALVRTLFQDGDGRLWVGTHGGGLSVRDGQRFRTVRAADGLTNDTVRAVYEDGRGRLWIGTNAAGLNLWSAGRLTGYAVKEGPLAPYTPGDAVSNDNVLALWADTAGTLWIGTDGGGLWRLRDGRIERHAARDALGINGVRRLLADGEGRLWIGTDGAGLDLLRDGALEALTSAEGLPSDIVLSLFQDSEHNLWVGTRDGLLRLKQRKVEVYGVRDGLANDFVTALWESRRGAFWVGTRAGIDLFDAVRGRARPGARRATNGVVSLLEDGGGGVWIGTRSGLLSLDRDGRHLTEYGTAQGLPSTHVSALAEARGGGVWVATRSGLVHIHDGVVRPDAIDQVQGAELTAVMETLDGTLWVGTDRRGLAARHQGRWRSWGIAEGLPHLTVNALSHDGESLWIATMGGLARLRAGEVHRYTTAQGLPSNQVLATLDDERGNLWLTSPRGIARVERTSFDEIDAGRARQVRLSSYGKADGLRTSECNGAVHPSVWRGRDGRLWFATVKGLAVIDPARIPSNPKPPPVAVEEVSADGEVLPRGGAGPLPPGVKRLEFHYTAPSFSSPEKVRFRYKLEGFDPEWIEAGGRRVAYYTNLPPGAYRFRVLANNEDGEWNRSGASYDLALRAHFHRTPAFWAACVVSAAVLVLALYRLHIRHVRAEFAAVLAERSRIAREIHDTLAQSFVGIGVQLETVAKMQSVSMEVARQHLDRARILVRSSLADARRTVWALRAQALEEADLGAALEAVAGQLSGDTDIAVRVSGRRRRLPADIENNLLRIGQEALANAVRHAQARTVRVELSFADGHVRLRVADDGRGFDVDHAAQALSGHFGLAGIRERVHHLRGELSLLSRSGGGAEVVVEVPVA